MTDQSIYELARSGLPMPDPIPDLTASHADDLGYGIIAWRYPQNMVNIGEHGAQLKDETLFVINI